VGLAVVPQQQASQTVHHHKRELEPRDKETMEAFPFLVAARGTTVVVVVVLME
jgi:hypothetical protein